MVYIESKSTNPAFNLALEQFVFDEMDPSNSYFMLWQNANTIVVGKYQNTLQEINREYVEENKIQVVRRLSGGGAVYHDLGNLNFTFVTNAQSGKGMDFSRFCQPVVQALRAFAVPAEMNGRNDMTIEGRKFSGNAQYIKNGRVMHHGTILYNSDLGKIGNALQVKPEKMRSKGVASVKSRVTNINEYMNPPVPLNVFKTKLVQEMFRTGDLQEYTLTPQQLLRVEELQKSRYDTWEWNYGASPGYEIEKSGLIEGCGCIEVQLQTAKEKIQAIQITGDFFTVGDLEVFQKQLVGQHLNREELLPVLTKLQPEQVIRNLSAAAFLDLLLQ